MPVVVVVVVVEKKDEEERDTSHCMVMLPGIYDAISVRKSVSQSVGGGGIGSGSVMPRR